MRKDWLPDRVGRRMAAAVLAVPLFLPQLVSAGEVTVEGVSVTQTGPGTYSFAVTLRHADEGWDHYADRWEVRGADGTVFGTRTLLHPHVNEQPFTRSAFGIEIPEGLSEVTVVGHDSVHGDGTPVTVELPVRE
ncbi:hypothetical protein [Jiella marina]|uniref:hypothetical protein n=1 Tax=Jiella sp. LLJ827 TaxID=2917712 RepID=UPI00210132EF|nr:hypothetical protein [Jiella sp. LLJ827]MCQ0986701.1 hypothetical protein [Jiella sp. LLJ827]